MTYKWAKYRIIIFRPFAGGGGGGGGEGRGRGGGGGGGGGRGVTESNPWVHRRVEKSITVVEGDERRRNTRGCALKCH